MEKGEPMNDLKPKGKDRLKKCPFCGGKAILKSWKHSDGNYYTVECPKCYVDMGEYETVEEITKAWNRRCEG